MSRTDEPPKTAEVSAAACAAGEGGAFVPNRERARGFVFAARPGKLREVSL